MWKESKCEKNLTLDILENQQSKKFTDRTSVCLPTKIENDIRKKYCYTILNARKFEWTIPNIFYHNGISHFFKKTQAFYKKMNH